MSLRFLLGSPLNTCITLTARARSAISTKLNLLKCLTRLLKFDRDLHKHTHNPGAMLGDVHFDQVEESRDSFVPSPRLTTVQAKPSGTPSRRDWKLM